MKNRLVQVKTNENVRKNDTKTTRGATKIIGIEIDIIKTLYIHFL